MKNLFRRIYIKHDNNMQITVNQKRLIVTDRKFAYDFPTDAVGLESMKISGYFKSLEALDTYYDGRDAFWAELRADDARVMIVGSREVVAELLIQYWKSIFKLTTDEAMYRLYTLFVANENLLAHHMKASIERDFNKAELEVEPLDFERFKQISEGVVADWTIAELNYRDIPIEYMLLSYFAHPNQVRASKQPLHQITFRKVYDIVLTNVVSRLVDAKREYLLSTHNFYKLRPENGDAPIGDTLAQIKADDNLSWILDPLFNVDNLNYVVGQYGLPKLKVFFDTYVKLFSRDIDEAFALDFLIANDIYGLLEYDALDEKGNFFGTEDYVFKINGLLVSCAYQLYRRGQKEELALYDLRLNK